MPCGVSGKPHQKNHNEVPEHSGTRQCLCRRELSIFSKQLLACYWVLIEMDYLIMGYQWPYGPWYYTNVVHHKLGFLKLQSHKSKRALQYSIMSSVPSECTSRIVHMQGWAAQITCISRWPRSTCHPPQLHLCLSPQLTPIAFWSADTEGKGLQFDSWVGNFHI